MTEEMAVLIAGASAGAHGRKVPECRLLPADTSLGAKLRCS